MTYRTVLSAFLILLIPALSGPAAAADYQRVESLLDTGKTIIGETVRYPESAPAKVQSLIVTMEPGEETGWHKHGVPTYGYMLEGELSVDYGSHGKRVYKAGTAFMEAIDAWHDGRNTGTGPARVLVVFMGAEGVPNVTPKP